MTYEDTRGRKYLESVQMASLRNQVASLMLGFIFKERKQVRLRGLCEFLKDITLFPYIFLIYLIGTKDSYEKLNS